MRRIALSLLAGVAACAPSRVDVAPTPGETVTYLQRFRIDERSSRGEVLPDITIEQHVAVRCDESDGERARVHIAYGDAAVWIEGDQGEPQFVATDAGAIALLYERDDAELAQVYAALWAAMAHLELNATLDRSGALHDVRGLEEVTRRRDGDVAADVGGSMLESLISDPSLLFLAVDEGGQNRIRVRLEPWNASFDISTTVREQEDGSYTLSYASPSGPDGGGPFAGMKLDVAGAGSRFPGTGVQGTRTLDVAVSADIPVGEGGTARRDAARVSYTLRRTSRE